MDRLPALYDRVQTASGGVSLQAGLLDCIFTQHVDFSSQQGGVPSQQTDIAQIKCGDGVQITSTSEVDGNLESREKLFVRDLFFDRLTGDVRGTGPGRLTSTRRGEGGLPMGYTWAAGARTSTAASYFQAI
jgi:hypothetical protein